MKVTILKHLLMLMSTTIIWINCTPSSTSNQQVDSENLLINQLGYSTAGPKKALSKLEATEFILIDVQGDIVFEGQASAPGFWELSGDQVRILDFSGFNTAGEYRICVAGECSYSFTIGAQLFDDLSDAALKSYYYARCSEAIPAKFGGRWSRAAGHPDTAVYVHSSAADERRPEGTVIPSPGGWYDAGDYGKYVVNSSITTWTILKSLESNTRFHQDQHLNIPESDNELPDILDEALVNLRWMLRMQDPNDGGVYHKLTTKGFDDFILPEETKKPRFVVQKSTAATLDFAATMAYGSRILQAYGRSELANQMQQAAESAWTWSVQHPEILYRQPDDISTGAYPDTVLRDEWYWAASELFLSTAREEYASAVSRYYIKPVTPKWDVVQALGAISLITSTQTDAYQEVRSDFIAYVDTLLKQESACPYLISMNEFAWGSNSDVANDGMLKLIAYDLTDDQKYLHSAQNDLDYILGRNTTGYSFVTGFGNKTPQVPHNRIFSADSIDEPIPGYIVGGPNTIVLKDCEPQEVARSEFPAASYVDVECSFSTNETAINWNAPLVFLTAGLSMRP